MNLNEFLINRGRGRGKRCNRNKNYTDMGPPLAPPARKKDNTPSTDWGKSHISIANTSSMHKSAGSSKFSTEDSRVIIALTEGRGEARCEVGIAVVNVSKPLLIICQISDTQSYVNTLTKINIFNPQEILVPLTFVETFSGNRLIDKVKERFPRIKYTGCPRSAFNKANGLDVLSNLCIPSLNAILLVLQHRYYALAAASALITYIQDNLFVYYATGSIKIDYQESEGYAIIDVSTADRLELVCSAKPAQGNKYSSLFGVLNHCMTKIGSRTLRSSILQPPCNVRYIEERLDAVEELIRRPEMLLSVQALLQKVPNIDQLLSAATLISDDSQKCSNRQLNYILLVNTVIDLVTPLKEVLARSSHPFFVQLTATLASDDFAAIRDIVRNAVQENAHPAKGEAAVMQRCFAIKPGINGLLDLVRKTYSERLDDMRKYVKRLAEKYDLPLTLGNNQTKGHHIVLSLNQKQKRYMKKSDLPGEFIEVHRLVGSFTMKTPELVNISTRLDDIMADILRVSNVMVHSIIVQIKKYMTLFYKLCEEIAYLDLLQSLAECSAGNGYVRPNFADFTEVEFSHHPMLDFMLSTKPVPNPISCSEDYNLHIITGPNGSGKSVFIRQVVLLQVMAQVGCYVPAQSATFRSADRMYARIYLEDNMEYGASSFILEMKEIKYIMTTMTENSLVVIDELCRSTSLEEGTALAIAIVEKLAQYSGFVYITTHFTLLAKLYDMYLNVKVWHLKTIPSGEDPRTFKLDFRHSLVPGVTTVKRYGVYIVRNIWPGSILKYVDALLDKISKKPKNPNIAPLDEKIRLKYKFESQLRKLKSQHKLTASEIDTLLNQYRDELRKLGCRIDTIQLSSNVTENVVPRTPRLEHSIFGDMAEAEDLRISNAMEQRFTPESMDLETQGTAERLQTVFTPQPSQQDSPSYQNFDDGNGIYENTDDNYENISRFIAETSENIHKLVPEVNLSYDESHKAGSEHFKHPSSLGGSRFSLLLQHSASKISTPVGSQAEMLSGSPVVQIYGSDRRNFSTSTNTNDQSRSFIIPERIALEGYDVESIQEDLEVCSRIFGEDDDDFEPESLNSIPNSCMKAEDKIGDAVRKEKSQHIFPIVKVVGGLNNTTLSFDEDIPDCGGTTKENEDPRALNKINIISDIVLAPRRPIEARQEEIIAKREDTSIEDKGYRPEEMNPFKDQPFRHYKHFDSTFDADCTLEENKFIQNYSEDDDNLECNLKMELDREKSKCTSSGYEIVAFDDPKQFLTSPSTDKTTNKAEKRESQITEEQDKSSPSKAGTIGIFNTFKLRKEDCTIEENQFFRNFTEDNLKGSLKMEPNREKSNCTSSGYEIVTMDDPKQFITSPSSDKTPNKAEKRESQTAKEQDKSSPSKGETTSISYASKMRKLDRSSSDSSQQDCTKKTITSLSSASKLRNLDHATTDSTSPNEKSDSQTRESSSLKESGGSSKSKTPKKKFSAPTSANTQNQSGSTSTANKGVVKRNKFVPPRKLSAKEIREDFQAQDRKMLETSPTSSNFSKYLEQLINRPTVKQVRNTTHLAMVRKTEEGVEVIAATPPKKTKTTPWKRQFSNESFNMAIFSDKNALPFESYLNSNEKDYNKFSFNFNRQQEGGKFEFAPTTSSVGEYTSKSVTKRFVRTLSETFCNQQGVGSAENRQDFTFLMSQQSINRSMTPDGFYKRNKVEIKGLVDKYLQAPTQEMRFGNTDHSRSIFDINDVDSSDLNI